MPYFYLDDTDDYPEIRTFGFLENKKHKKILGFYKGGVIFQEPLGIFKIDYKDMDITYLIDLSVWMDNHFEDFEQYVQSIREEFSKIAFLKSIFKSN